jgi:AAA+ superfamily predicted ATPase
MANPCPLFIHRKVAPEGTGSSLRFSSEQIGLLRQMTQESRTRFMMPCLRNKSAASEGNLALFSGPHGIGKTMAADMLVRELGVSMYRVNLNPGRQQVYRGDGKESGTCVENRRNEEGCVVV